MSSKSIRGFRLSLKQDGSGKITVEKKPQWGLDSSAKIAQSKRNKSTTRKAVKAMRPGQAAMFSPGSGGKG